MARHRFPPRAYGPFVEDNSLPKGFRGLRRYGVDGANVPFDVTSSLTWAQYWTNIRRTGVRRKKPVTLSPSAFTLDRFSHSSTGTITHQYSPPYQYQVDNWTGSLYQNYGGPTQSYIDAALKSSAEIAALMKLKKQSINLGVAFAERARTASLVGDSALAIVDSIRQFRRGNLRGAFKRLKAKPLRSQKMTSQWLALQYGWTPLLSDVHGACEALANRQLLDFAVRVASRKKKKIYVPRSYAAGYDQFSEIVSGELSYHVALNYMPKETLIRQFSSLGLTNPLEIIWELVPFSFVADWFVPVGKWLSSLDAAAGWSFTSGTVTRRSVCKLKTTYVPSFSYGTKRTARDFSMQAERFVVDRQLYASSPIPGRPSMKDARSTLHMANAMALLVGLFSRGKLANLSKVR